MKRRHFIKTGLLFLPAVASGQVGSRRVFTNPNAVGNNFTAVDFLPSRLNAGAGWSGLPTITNMTGETPQFRIRSQSVGNKPCLGTVGFQWGRKLAIGNNWTQIRLGMLHQSEATAGAFIYNTFLGMINNGKAWGVAGCNFIGLLLGGGSNWAYSANQYVSSAANEVFGNTNVNTASTSTQQALGACNIMTNDSGHRSLSFVELTKGSPNFTVQIYTVRAAANADQDMTEVDLHTGLGKASGSDMVISGKTLIFGSTTMAFSETNGNLDTVQVYIDATTSKASNLYAIGVRKIA